MPKITELIDSNEIALPISDQEPQQFQQESSSRKTTYGAYIKAGLVFAAATGTFVLAKANGSLSWMSSWFGSNDSSSDTDTQDLSELTTHKSKNKVSLPNTKDFSNSHAPTLESIEEFDVTDNNGNTREKFEELELLESNEDKANSRKLLSFSSGVIELSNLNGTNGFKINGEADSDVSGWSVSGAGDVNGDGFDDLIIGAPYADPNGDKSGISYVVFGKNSSFPSELELSNLNGTNGFKINGEAVDDDSGISVSGAGDINGDGFDDLIIGADEADPNAVSSAGRSYVIFGRNSSFPSELELSNLNGTNGFKINGEAVDDDSGISVSGAGDINGDGFDDLIIGADEADPNAVSSAGRSYVIFGRNSSFPSELELSNLNGTNGFKINGEAVDDDSGWSVSGAGDINGDGFDDIIICAYKADLSGSDFGRSYVIFGTNTSFTSELELSNLNGINGFKINGEAAEDRSGYSVSGAGDINGDGFDDVIIGAYWATPNWIMRAGISYVVFGKNSTFPSELELSSLNGTNGFKINGEKSYDYSGTVSSAGDTNGDGFDDIIIGAYLANPNEKNIAGRSYVVFGKKTPFPSELELSSLNGTNGFKINGETVGDKSGYSVSGAGDINGDGFDDIVIGAHDADPNGVSSAGRSYVIFGYNAPPILSSNTTNKFYTERGPALVIASGIEITDEDSLYMQSALISINQGFVQGKDILAFPDQNGILGFYDNSTGVLNLTGSASIANYQTALSNIDYFTKNNPTNITREFLITVNDGYSDSNAININVSVTAVNDAPTISSATSSLSYTEGDGAVVVNGDIEISDVDSTNISNATVSLISGFVLGEDVLDLSDQNGISGSYSSSTGVLTLSGDADIAEYQTALQSISYNNTAENPSEVQRTVSFVVNDGEDNSLSFTSDINVTAVNDAPTISSTTNSLSYTEGDGSIVINGDIEIDDVDDINLSNATVSITSGFVSVEDILEFKDQSGITGSYLNDTGILTLTGDAPIGDYQTALRSVRYTNPEENPSEVQRTISFMVNDGDANSLTLATTLNVTGVNDIPVLSSSTSILSYTEGDGAVVINGDIEINDVDDVSLSNATVFIKSGFISGEDILEFKDQSGITGSYSNDTGILTLTGNAAIGDYQTALRSVKYNNPEEDPSEVQRVTSFTVNDGEANSLSFIMNINVAVINSSLPVLSSSTNSLSYTEGDGLVVVNGNISISDLDSPNLSNGTVSIKSGFISGEDVLEFIDQSGITGSYDNSTGVLTLTGTATVPEYQTALREVRYNNTEVNPSEVKRTISFIVNDGEADSLSFTTDINVLAVNSLPIISSATNSLLYTEGDGAVVINGDLEVSDIDNINLIGATVSITSGFVQGEDILEFFDQSGIAGVYSSSNGILTLTGSATVAQYQDALRSVTYRNIEADPSKDQRILDFVVNDGSDDSVPFTTNVTIAAVNELPVVSSLVNTLSYTEGSGPIAINRNITVSDPDGTNIEGAMISITTNFVAAEDTLGFSNQNGISGLYNATTGKLTLTGSATLSQYQTALRNVTYNNPEESPTTSQRAVSFIVNDGSDDSVAFTTFINIAELLDAPVISGVSGTIYYTENDSPRIINNGITVTDPDSTNLQSASVSIISGRSVDDVLEYIQSTPSGVTISYNSNTGVLSFSGTASISDVETFFNNVVFSNAGDNPSGNRRTISFVTNDGNSDSNALTSYVNVTAVDDPLVRNTDITISNSALNTGESFNVPLDITDLFTDPDDNITLTATKPDGSPLPNWCYFDPETVTLSGLAPSSEESLQIKLTADNGKETVSSNVFIFSFTNDSPASSGGGDSFVGELLGYIGGGICAGLVGLGFWKYRRTKESNQKWDKYPLANRLRRRLNLDMSNPNSNDHNKGYDFRTVVQALKKDFSEKGGYGSDVQKMTSGELDLFTGHLTSAIKDYNFVTITPSCFPYFMGNKIKTNEILLNSEDIVEMTQRLEREEKERLDKLRDEQFAKGEIEMTIVS